METREDLERQLLVADKAARDGNAQAAKDAKQILASLDAMGSQPAPKPKGMSFMDAVREANRPQSVADVVRGTSGKPTLARYLQARGPQANPIERGVLGFGKSLANTGTNIGELAGIYPKGTAKKLREAYAPTLDHGAGTVGQVVGDVVQLASPARLAGRVTKAKGVLGGLARTGAQAGVGAGYGALTSEDRASGAKYGAAFGALGQLPGEVLAAGGARLAQPVKQAAKFLQGQGVRVLPAQLMREGPLRSVTNFFAKLPFAGESAAVRKQSEELTSAFSRTFGENAPEVSEALFTQAEKRLGDGFNRILGGRTFELGPEFASQGARIVNAAGPMGKKTQKIIGAHLDDAIARGEGGGIINGEVYKALRKDLAAAIKSQSGPSGAAGAKEGLIQLRTLLDRRVAANLRKVDVKLADDLVEHQRAWANMKVAEEAFESAGGLRGQLPADVMRRLTGPKKVASNELRGLAKSAEIIGAGRPAPGNATLPGMASGFGAAGGGYGVGAGIISAPTAAGIAAGAIGAGRIANASAARLNQLSQLLPAPVTAAAPKPKERKK